MGTGHWPSLGQVLDYLRALGFTVGPLEPRHIVARHPEEGSWFVFPDQDLAAPARTVDLVDMKVQLPGRGFVTDEEFARFWHPGMQRTATPSPVSPQ